MKRTVAGFWAFVVVALAAGCGASAPDRDPAPDTADPAPIPADRPAGGPEETSTPEGIRFVLRVGAAAGDTVFVQRNREDRPAAWLTILRDGAPVTYWERCEVSDCGAPTEAVCGAMLPEVVALVPGSTAADSVWLVWNGLVSETSPAGCERRVRPEPGEYVARFCWGGSMRSMPDAPPVAETRLGYVEAPECDEQPFTLGVGTVVLKTIEEISRSTNPRRR